MSQSPALRKKKSAGRELSHLYSFERNLRNAFGDLRKKSGCGDLAVRRLARRAAEDKDWRERTARGIRVCFAENVWPTLLSQSGPGLEHGILSEIPRRCARKLLPRAIPREALRRVLAESFSREDCETLENLSPLAIRALVHALFDRTEIVELTRQLLEVIGDALLILGAEIAGFGLSEEMRDRLPLSPVARIPFLSLDISLQNVARSLGNGVSSSDESLLAFDRALEELENGYEAVRQIFACLEKRGVSISLVYRLDSLTRCLDRVNLLLRLGIGNSPTIVYGLGARLFAELVRCSHSRSSLSELLSTGTRLLARKVVERAGHSGEHYITRNRAEYYAMLRSAGGGGVFIVVSAFLKSSIGQLGFSPTFSEFLGWINYAGSFLCLQFLGLTLATKQPSMTAPALAKRLRDLDYRFNVSDFIDEVACLTRSQWAAFVGNIGAVVPSALLFTAILRYGTGHPVYDMVHAEHAAHSLHPWHSLTLPYAAWTGVLLWFSSLFAGWTENWIIFHSVPESLAGHAGLRAVFGSRRTAALSRWFAANITGIAANVSLGFVLAFTPLLGRAVGIPMEVRHVTLSTASLVFSAFTLGTTDHSEELLGAGLGVILIGLLNFLVSFSLALWVAAKAKGVRRGWFTYLVKAILLRFVRKPLVFLYPPNK